MVNCIHLISCCLWPISYFSAAASWARVRIVQRELGIETHNRIVFYYMHIASRETLRTVFVCELLF